MGYQSVTKTTDYLKQFGVSVAPKKRAAKKAAPKKATHTKNPAPKKYYIVEQSQNRHWAQLAFFHDKEKAFQYAKAVGNMNVLEKVRVIHTHLGSSTNKKPV